MMCSNSGNDSAPSSSRSASLKIFYRKTKPNLEGKKNGWIIKQLVSSYLYQKFHITFRQSILIPDQTFDNLFQIRQSKHIVTIEICWKNFFSF